MTQERFLVRKFRWILKKYVIIYDQRWLVYQVSWLFDMMIKLWLLEKQIKKKSILTKSNSIL